MNEFFPEAYRPDNHDRSIFGKNYQPPKEFKHGEWHSVAKYEKLSPTSDGYAVEVFECRAPARFYKIVALPDTNYKGEPRPGFTMNTGASWEVDNNLPAIIAMINEGLLAVRP